jgi:AbrB family looped-hinge helix DNA binding protein
MDNCPHIPLVGLVQVEIDTKGRVLIPSSVRRKIGSKRFEIRLEDNTIVLEGLPDPESVRGKYKGLLGGKSISTIEEEQEVFLSKHTR